MECVSTRIVYENKWLKVREDTVIQNGREQPYGVLERSNSCVVVPISPLKRTFLLRQLRYPTQAHSWEVPGGSVDEGEDVESAAFRELFEETRIAATQLDLVGVFHPVPALTAQLATVFLARIDDAALDAAFSPSGTDDILSYGVFELSEVFDMVRKGEITDGFTMAALMSVHVFLARDV